MKTEQIRVHLSKECIKIIEKYKKENKVSFSMALEQIIRAFGAGLNGYNRN